MPADRVAWSESASGCFHLAYDFFRFLKPPRIQAGLAAAKKRGRVGGRPRAIGEEKLQAIVEALDSGRSKAEVCRLFDVKRSTLIDALARL